MVMSCTWEEQKASKLRLWDPPMIPVLLLSLFQSEQSWFPWEAAQPPVCASSCTLCTHKWLLYINTVYPSVLTFCSSHGAACHLTQVIHCPVPKALIQRDKNRPQAMHSVAPTVHSCTTLPCDSCLHPAHHGNSPFPTSYQFGGGSCKPPPAAREMKISLQSSVGHWDNELVV